MEFNENTLLAHKKDFENIIQLKIDLTQKRLSEGIVEVNFNDSSIINKNVNNLILYRQVEFIKDSNIDAITYAFNIDINWLVNKCICEFENGSKFVQPFIYQNYDKYSSLKGS